ncbi:MAG: glutathione S-transferase family protein [Chromatiales bacterium]|nr:MAG: glutathione S-transferase family protein [Chromatiales bacterium]
MADIILHHFDLSPFAEKARLALGFKGLAWQSVQIPLIMPKPDLEALTGGYRKTPVMQIGADIYCDTQRIAAELERRYPEPGLFPGGNEGLAFALSAWSDKAFFEPGAGLAMGTNAEIPEPLLADRKAFFNFMDFDTLADSLPHLYGQLRSHVALVDRQLADGRPYLLGDQPGWADILAYFPVWMVRGNVQDIEALLGPFKALAAWADRVAAFGHGERAEIDAEQALQVARDTPTETQAEVDPDDPLQLSAGDRVTVSPDDYGMVPVAGDLVRLTIDDIGIRREDRRAGEVVVNFPRRGYKVEAA